MRHRILFYVYLIIALIALYICWKDALYYFVPGMGLADIQLNFIRDATSNPGAHFVFHDILFVYLAISIWLFFDARDLDIKGWWVYILFMFLIAVSVVFPLYLAIREIKLEEIEARGS